jgi:tetratricopeptide (TPR) repeat protein
MSLSACLIVRDEERFLPRCLASLQGHVDEICILDTGSVDATLEIARSFGARIGHMPWNDDFSRARNASLDLASGDWILQIDADEELVSPKPGLLASLQASSAVCHLVQLDLLGSGGRSERVQQPRLFRRDPRLRFRRPLHETILDGLAEANLPSPQPCSLLLIHHGYTDEIVASRSKHERNTRILRACRERGEADAYDLFKLAAALEATCDPRLDDEILSCWIDCAASGSSKSRRLRSEWPWWPRAVAGAAQELWLRGRLGEALRVSALVEEYHPEPALKRCRARLELAVGLPDRALRWLSDLPQEHRLTALALFENGRVEEALQRLRPHSELAPLQALLRFRQGAVQESLAVLETGFATLDDDANALADAAEVLAGLGDTPTALALLQRPCRGDRPALVRHRDLRQHLSGAPPNRPPRDTVEAAQGLLRSILEGKAPAPLDEGFSRQVLRGRLADLLEAQLLRGQEFAIRTFAQRAPAWEPVLPGIGSLVSGA